MDWLKKLKDYAPDIAMAVISGGTTLPQLALKAVADAVGIDTINSQESLAQFVTGATPESMLELKKANNEFTLEMRRLELDWEKAKLEDQQQIHSVTQQTIINGDNATDKVIRLTRPTMAKQSWTATIWYCIGCFGVQAITDRVLFDILVAGILSSPAWAYLGLRTGDKFTEASKHWGKK